MNWQRLVLGPPGRGLGRSRWPLATILAVAVAVFAATAEDWTMFGLVAAAAVLFAVVTVRSHR